MTITMATTNDDHRWQINTSESTPTTNASEPTPTTTNGDEFRPTMTIAGELTYPNVGESTPTMTNPRESHQ